MRQAQSQSQLGPFVSCRYSTTLEKPGRKALWERYPRHPGKFNNFAEFEINYLAKGGAGIVVNAPAEIQICSVWKNLKVRRVKQLVRVFKKVKKPIYKERVFLRQFL